MHESRIYLFVHSIRARPCVYGERYTVQYCDTLLRHTKVHHTVWHVYNVPEARCTRKGAYTTVQPHKYGKPYICAYGSHIVCTNRDATLYACVRIVGRVFDDSTVQRTSRPPTLGAHKRVLVFIAGDRVTIYISMNE